MTLDKIVPFRRPAKEPEQKLILYCNNCDCRTFEINVDTTIECANCGEVCEVITTDWTFRPPVAPPPEAVNRDRGYNTVTRFLDPDAAILGVLAEINRWRETDTLEFVVAYNKSGLGRTWSRLLTQDDKDYILTKLKEVVEHVERAAVQEVGAPAGEEDG